MNALNIISALGSSPTSASRSRSGSLGNQNTLPSEVSGSDDAGDGADSLSEKESGARSGDLTPSSDEITPLLHDEKAGTPDATPPLPSWRLYPKRAADIVVTSIKVVLSAALAPIHYIVACFYDEDGNFSAMLPLRRIYNIRSRKRRRKLADDGSAFASGHSATTSNSVKSRLRPKRPSAVYGAAPAAEVSDGFRSESSEADASGENEDSPARNTRSKSSPADEPTTRSMRIKIQSADAQKKRHSRHKSIDGSNTEDDRMNAVANALKSPSSATTMKLKYPRAPAPPRPLVPKRQPSYSNLMSADAPRKTLILDLDETLIHSMAKGGRMSTGHMVEIKFRGTIQAAGGNVVLGPQVPILYYVHERPYCHEFLRKVSKWFNLIVFTASVQEYADPVIDWLERERAYFVGRYYRQHCTYRNGAYIKDLSQVEPDLSKVMLLDNSPMSYIFHEDNAIPIEGWISDPTDNDLLHLIPFLEGLQYVTDVRALLALRMGQQKERELAS